VLIEGMIGAGKSTLAARVADWLVAHGRPARAVTEFASDNPIRTPHSDRLRHQLRAPAASDVGSDGLARDISTYGLEQWSRLAAAARPDAPVMVMESYLLQASVLPLVLKEATEECVIGTFDAIMARLVSAMPLLVYLRTPDIGTSLARTRAQRGRAWSVQNVEWVSAQPWARARRLTGPATVETFYRTWEPQAEALVARAPVSTLMIDDAASDWDQALRRLCQALREGGLIDDVERAGQAHQL
jgi:hypothetical protein